MNIIRQDPSRLAPQQNAGSGYKVSAGASLHSSAMAAVNVNTPVRLGPLPRIPQSATTPYLPSVMYGSAASFVAQTRLQAQQGLQLPGAQRPHINAEEEKAHLRYLEARRAVEQRQRERTQDACASGATPAPEQPPPASAAPASAPVPYEQLFGPPAAPSTPAPAPRQQTPPRSPPVLDQSPPRDIIGPLEWVPARRHRLARSRSETSESRYAEKSTCDARRASPAGLVGAEERSQRSRHSRSCSYSSSGNEDSECDKHDIQTIIVNPPASPVAPDERHSHLSEVYDHLKSKSSSQVKIDSSSSPQLPARGITQYTLEELCEEIRSSPDLATHPVDDLYRREIPTGVQHEFIIVRSAPRSGRPATWIRIDRAAMGYHDRIRLDSRYAADDTVRSIPGEH